MNAPAAASILGPTTPQQFLRRHWQREPLLVRGASDAWGDVLSPQELAGLAMEDAVESRIVSVPAGGGPGQWQLTHGPFEAQQFTDAAAEGWTLMVQSVDQWLPEVAAIIKQFDFLPAWRLDDVMVSYAAPGGGVGPHFDYYDVFLLQTRGRRRWQLGQRCDESTALQPDQPLRCLSEFIQSAEYQLGPGDMLYVPAGLAHWGTSLDADCMTWSIGFRAPSAASLLGRAVEHLAPLLPLRLRYQDSDASLNAPPGQMNAAVDAQLHGLLAQVPPEQWLSVMRQALGELMTESRYDDLRDPMEQAAAWDLWQQYRGGQQALTVSDRSRFAYRENDNGCAELFVDGQRYEVSAVTAQWLCEGRFDRADLPADEDAAVLASLIADGCLVREE